VHCGRCGCALVGEKKKGKYVYYHCTGNKGKCPERISASPRFGDYNFGTSPLPKVQIGSSVLPEVESVDAARGSGVGGLG